MAEGASPNGPDAGGPQLPGTERGSDEGQVNTFLIADVRGYTLFSQEHGDEAAGRLAARFAEVTAQVIGARGGSDLELRGDEALCIFPTTRRAIRAAIDLQARFLSETERDPTLPLAVGIGIDTGEAVPVAGGFRGRALNLAARLCASARAGEILASRVALHMAGRMDGIHVEDRGLASFKGISEPVGVVRVTGEGEDPARWFAAHFPSQPASTPRPFSGRRPVIGAIAVVAVVVLVAALLRVVGQEPARASFQPGIAIVDQLTGEPRASIPTSGIRQPAEVIHAEGNFWVHNLDPNSFVEIDPRSGRVMTQIAAPFEEIGTFTVDGGTLWVTGPRVVKIDIGLRREVDRFVTPGRTHGVLVAEGSLWVTMPSIDTTLRLDPASGEVERTFADLPGSLALAYGDGSVWTAGWTGLVGGFSKRGGVNRIDPDTNGVTRSHEPVLPLDCCPAAAGGGFVWTADPAKGIVYKVDQTGHVVSSNATGPGATIGSFDGAMVWVGNSDVGTVSGIDALTGDRRTLRFEHPVQGVAAGSGFLAVTLGPGRTYEGVIGELDGKVARFFVPPGLLATPDPVAMFGEFAFWVEAATCAKLLNYGDASDGFSLQPEVAATMPNISPDGRTYTFTVRSDYRFSPPSNETVTAATFRHSLERALTPGIGGPGPYFIPDIKGERAFLAGDVDHISGLRAEGDTLTIELTEPSPNFLERLSVPFFCPVPTDTPPVPGGAGAYAGYPHRVPLAVPSAGPYYIADHLDGEYAILKRNPNYTGPRPHAFDAIALREGVDTGLAVGQVESGSWDGIIHVSDPLLYATGPVAEKYGDKDGSGEGLGFHATPSPVIFHLAFNSSRGPFSDPDVRRAAALAIDRDALAAIWGLLPADQFLPPVMWGFEELDLYPLDGSGIDEARTLMRGRTVTAVMAIDESNDLGRQEAEVVSSNLAAIGITVQIEEFPDRARALRERDAKIDLISTGNVQPYGDPAPFLFDTLLVTMPRSWLPEGVAEQVERLLALTGEERRSATVALADRLATIEVPIAASLSGAIPTLLGPSLGCQVFPPLGFGVDLAALCPSEA
jgi:ABC-type transport system substrate-binding protein/class 3 adenylate cyclase